MRVVFIALGLYLLLGFLLIEQKPGLNYDEALLVQAAIHMRHSNTEITLPHEPGTWVCKHGRCFPIMGEGSYVGAVKDYLCLPLFAAFSSRTGTVRLVSMLLGMLGIWGLARLIREQVSHGAGDAVALILAVNPAYLNMMVFDNGQVAPMMAGLGLTCAALSIYLDRRSLPTAASLGVAAGFAVWARANSVWTLVAAVLAAVIIYRKRLLIPLSHGAAIVCGGVAGGFPFLWYQVVSRGGTLRTISSPVYTSAEALTRLFYSRAFWLADTLLSDGEHRAMWGAAELSRWQLWLWPTVIAAACAVCFAMRAKTLEQSKWARFTVLALLLLGGFLFTSHLEVSEHHLIAMLPLAVTIVVIACMILQQRRSWGWMVSVAIALIYFPSAMYWQIASVQGLHRTGGIGMWSDGVVRLGRELGQDYSGRPVKMVDWGVQANLFVVMDGHLNSKQIYQQTPGSTSESTSNSGRPWLDEIREGGLFIVTGPSARTFDLPAGGFLRALAAARPVMRTKTIFQRDGSAYVAILDIEPNTVQGSAPGEPETNRTLSMGDPRAESSLRGFYERQPAGWRWTKPEFSVILDRGESQGSPALLTMQLFIPPDNIAKLGPITLSGSIGDHLLAPETFSREGQYTFSRAVPGEWLQSGLNQFDFHVDKHLGPSPQDSRQLGIVASSVSLEPAVEGLLSTFY